MLLTITTTYQPATDLGFLLYKHPARVQSFSLNFGKAYIFYPEATTTRCTMALLLELDPLKLTGRKGQKPNFVLQPYINDRPYVASSFLSVAIGNLFRTALNGECHEKPELVQTPIPLQINLPVVPSRRGQQFIHQLFEPLGYEVATQRHILDDQYSEWGDSHYFDVTLTQVIQLSTLLTHLYVLIPVLDNDKHYWVGQDEIDKLLRRGHHWLATHPAKEQITARYLKNRRRLVQDALRQLRDQESELVNEVKLDETDSEQQLNLHQKRLQAVFDVLKEYEASRVIDVGCGEGRLLRLLLNDEYFQQIVGVDVSWHVLERAAKRLRLDRLSPRQKERIALQQGSLLYCDQRLKGYDAVVLVEVIEHLEPDRLPIMAQVVFGVMKPQIVIITTPNREYNVMWPSLPADKFRHYDHRFEWTRAEFIDWAQPVAAAYEYQVVFQPIGPIDETYGAPTQMGVFVR